MDFSKLVYAYAISGGIGSGKSTACGILQSLGYEVIDCDKIAHNVLDELSGEVTRYFGSKVLDEWGKINRARLGEIVFEDCAKREKLEELLYPKIEEKLWERCERLEAQKKIYFVEIPLLFEKIQRFNFVNKILVYAPREKQVERVMLRNNFTQREAIQRIEAQIDIEQKRRLASVIFKNTSTQEELKNQIFEWIRSKKA